MPKPEHKKSILFLINGLGMGNSTRCFSLIERLAGKGIRIDVMTSGNGLVFFEDKKGNQIDQLIETKNVYYGKSKEGKLSVTQTLISLFKFISIYFANNRLVESYLKIYRPGAVVVDSEYIFYPMYRRGIPIIALNNSDMVFSTFFKIKDKPFAIFPQFFFVECFDFLFHFIIPTKVISPRLNNFFSFRKKFSPVGPIVRKKCRQSQPNPIIKNVVIMLSGSAFGSQVDLREEKFPFQIDVIGRSGENQKGVTFHGKVLDNYDLINHADMLVINAGFSAVSEAIYMKKPMVVIPVENHAEQYINAKIVEIMGLGISCQPQDMADNIKQLSAEVHKYQSKFSDTKKIPNGSDEAVELILSCF